jgi:hypothetical protein
MISVNSESYYQDPPSGTPPPPPGSDYTTRYPERSSQEYAQPRSGYEPPSGYAQPRPGYVPPSGYAQSGPGYAPPSGYAQPRSGYVPPSGYAQPVYMGVAYVPPMPDPGKGMAIAGFVLGIISVCLLCTLYGAISNLVVGGLGITFSLMGRKSTTSRGLAIAGLVMSIIGVVAALIWAVIIVAIIIASASTPQ